MQTQNKPTSGLWNGALVVTIAVVGGVAFLSKANPAGLLQPWYLTRAAGLVAYVLLWGAVAVGLLQSLGSLKGVTGPAANLDVHEHLSLWSLYATTFHGVILLWDRYVSFDWFELLVPLVSDYEPWLVAAGILSVYVSLLVTVSTYLRTRLTPRRWRAIHLLSLVGFLLALIHGAAMGSDSGDPVVAYLYRFTGLSVAVLTIFRLIREVRARYANPAGRG